MFKKNVNVNIIYEIRDAESASNIDLKHINDCADNEIRLIFFKVKDKTVAIGKNQNDKYINHNAITKDDVKLIRKVTNGTAVYFSGNELILSIVLGKDTTISSVPSVIQKTFITRINNIFREKLNIASVLCTHGSKHKYIPAGCFNALTRNEIAYENKKLGGCSFTKTNNKIFGHFMLYFDKSYSLLDEYIVCNSCDKISPISLKELGVNIKENELCELIIQGLINNE